MREPFELAGKILAQEDPGGFSSIALYGESVLRREGQDEGDTFHLENETGQGDITLYRVFPGIELIYNDMHMEYCNKEQQAAPEVVEINYCREGRCECLFGENTYCYMAAGDLSFCSLQNRGHQSVFPTSHYHGITVTLDYAAISEEMKTILELLCIDVEQIRERSGRQEFTMVRANPAIGHIFSEMETVPPSIRLGYIRVKVLELLLVLTGFEPGKQPSRETHFSRVQIEQIKQVHAFLVEHYNRHYTIEWLAERFSLSPTVLKKCFRGVYGEAVYSYMKRYRLQVAERLLQESDMSVAQIASQIGYLNPNKFTSAFRAVYGVTPTAFRRNQTESGPIG